MDYKAYYLKDINKTLSSYGLNDNLISDILLLNFDEIMYILAYLDDTMNKYKTEITSEDYYPVISSYSSSFSSSTTPAPIISKPHVPSPIIPTTPVPRPTSPVPAPITPPTPVPRPPAASPTNPVPIIPRPPVLSPDEVTLQKYTREFDEILNSYSISDSTKMQETKKKLEEVFKSDNPIVLKNKLFKFYIIMNFDNTILRYYLPPEIFTNSALFESEFNKLYSKFKDEFVIKTFEKYYNGSDKKLRLFYLLYLFEINKIYDTEYLDKLINIMVSTVK